MGQIVSFFSPCFENYDDNVYTNNIKNNNFDKKNTKNENDDIINTIKNKSFLYSNELDLLGEDRTYGGNLLYIDMIPKVCWFKNIRNCINPRDWNLLRKKIYKRVDYKCECCGFDALKYNKSLEAHERWEFDYNTNTQKLKRIIALCKYCHLATHLGFSKKINMYSVIKNHLKKIRNFDDIELDKHIKEAYNICNYKNKFFWKLDLSILDDNNIEYNQNQYNDDEYENID